MWIVLLMTILKVRSTVNSADNISVQIWPFHEHGTELMVADSAFRMCNGQLAPQQPPQCDVLRLLVQIESFLECTA